MSCCNHSPPGLADCAEGKEDFKQNIITHSLGNVSRINQLAFLESYHVFDKGASVKSYSRLRCINKFFPFKFEGPNFYEIFQFDFS